MKMSTGPISVLLLIMMSGCSTTSRSEDEAFASALGRMMAGQSQVQGAAYDSAVAEADNHPLGSAENPVRAEMPAGQRAYLDRLRCPDGSPPSYDRRGSGPGGPFGNIVDYYEVTCSGASRTTVVMDMYHAGYVEDVPVTGFTILPR